MSKTTAFFRLGLVLIIATLLWGVCGYISPNSRCFLQQNQIVSPFREQALLQQEYEARLQREITESLGQLLGKKSVHASVSVQLDLTEITSKGKGKMAVRSIGQDIDAISVSVLVDSPRDKNQIYHPLSKAQLKRYSDIVKAIIGYDAARGDKVLVLNQPFKSDFGFEKTFWTELLFWGFMVVFMAILLGLLVWPSSQQREFKPQKGLALARVKDVCLKSPTQASDILKRWIARGKLEEASIVLLAAGTEQAKLLFRYLKQPEIQKVIQRMRLLGKIPPKVLCQTLYDFLRELALPRDLTGSDSQVQELLRSLPNGQEMYAEILASGPYQTLWDKLNASDTDDVYRFLKTQSPENVAFVLFHLADEVSGKLLQQMPEEVRGRVLLHLKHIRSMGDQVQYRLMGKMAREFYRFTQAETAGMKKISAILKTLSEQEQRRLKSTQTLPKIQSWQDVLSLSERQKIQLLTYLDLGVLAAALAGGTIEEVDLFLALLSVAQKQSVLNKIQMGGNTEQARKIMIKTAQELFG